jgi:hypothetical protein
VPGRLYALSIIHVLELLLFLLLWLGRLVVRAYGLRCVILGAALSYNLKTADLGLVKVNFRGHLHQIIVPSDEDMWQRAAEVRTVKIGGCLDTTSTALLRFPLLDHVNFFALRAVDFDTTVPKPFAKANWYAFLIVAKGPWACAKHAFQVLSSQLGQT